MINKQKLTELLLPGVRERVGVFVYGSIGSTNDAAKSLEFNGDAAVVFAEEQTAGKGRLGRVFNSPRGGLYMSIVCPPAALKNYSAPGLLTCGAGLITAECIERFCGKAASLKWVNDVYTDGKKTAGVLCESVSDSGGAPLRVVTGIGVNISRSEQNSDFGALFCAGHAPPFEPLAADIINRFFGFDFGSDFIPQYKKRCFTLGNYVTVQDNPPYAAYALDIAPDGALTVKRADETVSKIEYGEVSVRVGRRI
ncbi:MAG: biotin--[acetyl-CoA-carboxylase] ligase [Clostridiales bacterium]|jgi:BirA family biotin operon repressor/biotin-[acetyl-CoA-carboxylase] ligase|nr:biotin--[acetyl-CoA-carboxylase] ligase [Clostridiales bacterium]